MSIHKPSLPSFSGQGGTIGDEQATEDAETTGILGLL
jgi:hypothetical protein